MTPNPVYVGVFPRIIARIVDNIVLEVASIIIALLAGGIVGIAVAVISGVGASALGSTFVIAFIVWIAASLFGPFLYHAYFIRKTGQTFGKKILDVRVVGKDGKPISYSTAFIRAFVNEFLCIFPISLVHIIMIHLNPEKRGLHDVIAGTYVIKEGKNA